MKNLSYVIGTANWLGTAAVGIWTSGATEQSRAYRQTSDSTRTGSRLGIASCGGAEDNALGGASF